MNTDVQQTAVSRLRRPTTSDEEIASYVLGDADIAALFQEIAISDLGGRLAAPQLMRWAAPVRIGLIGHVAPIMPGILAVYAAFLQAATGHQVSVADLGSGGQANLGVLVSGNPMEDVLGPFWPNVASIFRQDRGAARDFAFRAARGAPTQQELHLQVDQGVIISGLIAVSASMSPLAFYASFWSSLFGAMGLLGRLTSFAHSVMAADHRTIEPSPLDRILLALLYGPGFRPGMEGAEINAVLPTAVANARNWEDFDALAPLPPGNR